MFTICRSFAMSEPTVPKSWSVIVRPLLRHVGDLGELVFDHQHLFLQLPNQLGIIEELGVFGCEYARHPCVSRRRAYRRSPHDSNHGDCTCAFS